MGGRRVVENEPLAASPKAMAHATDKAPNHGILRFPTLFMRRANRLRSLRLGKLTIGPRALHSLAFLHRKMPLLRLQQPCPENCGDRRLERRAHS